MATINRIKLKHIEIWRGKKAIEEGTGKGLQTIRTWAKKYGCPLRHDPGNKAYIIAFEYVTWLQRFDDHMKGRE